MRARKWIIALLTLGMLLTALPATMEELPAEPAVEQTLEPEELPAEPAVEQTFEPEELTAAPIDAPLSAEGETDLGALFAEDEQQADLSQYAEPTETTEEVPEPPLADAAPQMMEAAPTGIEALPDGTFVCQPPEEFYTVEVDTDLTDEDLFAGFANRLFYGHRDVLMATMNAGEHLTGQNRVVYDTIKPEILKVAEGSRTSTEFGVPILQLIGKTQSSAADMGVALAFDANGRLTDECVNSLFAAFYRQIQVDVSRVSTALWYDCTYEMYWFNRYQSGLGSQLPPVSLKYDAAVGDYVVSAASDAVYMFRFSVLTEFASGTYVVDMSKTNAVKNAAANAKAVVNKYKDCSDYAKLYAYAWEVCHLAGYNTPASRDGWDMSEQNPWKLIWVFDGDPATTVVCEGYTQAFQYLCELSDFDSGVRCYTVDGIATEKHAWNLVRMGDGKNYVVDVTWMDGPWADAPVSDLASAINNESNAGLFLVGGLGSVGDGYTVNHRTGSNTSYRTYSERTLAAYPADMLTIAGAKFVPTGLMRISGSTYYFDENGRYVTGNRTIDGMVYNFGNDGRLTSVVATGKQTIDGKEYYFDENGNLHTEHQVETVAGKAATCTADGYTESKRCKICKTVLEEPVTIPAPGHLWGNPNYVWSDDYSSVTATRTCVHDGKHVQRVKVNTSANVVRKPACEQTGETVYTASFYNDGFTTQTRTVETPATGHNVVIDVGYAATCTTDGLTNGSHCADCNTVFEAQQVIPAMGHSVVVDAGYAATCTTDGLTNGSHCAVCGAMLEAQQVIPATGHSVVVDAGYAATCTADGLTNGSHCAVCGAMLEAQQVIPATGHSPVVDPGYPATLTAAGVTDGSHCAVCGAVLVAQQPIPALCPQLTLAKLKSNGKVSLSKGDIRQIVPAFAAELGLTVTGYKSSKPAVVSVDGNGFLTCNAEGKAKITVTTNNRRRKATITIKVVDPYKPTAIAIAQGKSVVLVMGQQLQLGVGLAPETAQTTLTWSTSKPNVATVDQNGLITPQGEGKAKITVKTHNKKKARITVKVVDPNKPLGIAIAQGKAITLKAGETFQLNAAVSPATAQSALTWKTSKSKVATVDANGVVTAHAKGKAKITVRTYNKKKATITVNVVP